MSKDLLSQLKHIYIEDQKNHSIVQQFDYGPFFALNENPVTVCQEGFAFFTNKGSPGEYWKEDITYLHERLGLDAVVVFDFMDPKKSQKIAEFAAEMGLPIFCDHLMKQSSEMEAIDYFMRGSNVPKVMCEALSPERLPDNTDLFVLEDLLRGKVSDFAPLQGLRRQTTGNGFISDSTYHSSSPSGMD